MRAVIPAISKRPEGHAVIRRWRPNSAINGWQTWSLWTVPIASLLILTLLAVLIIVGDKFMIFCLV